MPDKLKLLYNHAFISNVAHALQNHISEFDEAAFIGHVFDSEWEKRELKERMHHITHILAIMLPQKYTDAVSVLKNIAPEMDQASNGGYLNMFLPHFVELYGAQDWDVSMDALEAFTEYGSSEFAVRVFIKSDAKRMMEQMQQWALHDNYHVRRLASEGCRTRLPWATALCEFKKDPSLILPILETLKDDSHAYVRRSVANNLNDIAKDHPNIVLDIARRWLGHNSNRDRLIKHACRTLLKSSHKEALALFGFYGSNHITLKRFELDKAQVSIGDEIGFWAVLNIEQEGKVRMEYAIDFAKARGQTSRKIFQISERSCSKETITLSKTHSFKELSTRKHYSGKHQISLLVNGVVLKSLQFNVV